MTVKTSITSENSQQSWQSLESILPIIWKHSNYFICKTMRRKFLFSLNKWSCALYFGTKEMKNGHISLQLLGNSSVTWFSTEAHCHTVILLSVVIQSVIIHFFSLSSLISCGINSPTYCLEDWILGVVITCVIFWNSWNQNTVGQIHPWSNFSRITAARPEINLTL